jgi:tRNA(Ile)-lysidine synthase
MTDRLLATAVSLDAAGFCRLDPAPFRDAPEEIGLRALSRLLLTVSGLPHPARLKRLERLYSALMAGRRNGSATLQRCRLLSHRDGVLICREARDLSPLALRPNETALWDCRFRVALTTAAGGEAIPVGLFVAALGEAGYRMIKDEIAPERRALVPAPARPSVPALWDGRRVIAAPHFGFRREGFENLGFRAEFAPRWPLFARSSGSGLESAMFTERDIV